MAKEKKATDQINISLAALEGLTAIMETSEDPVTKKLAATAKIRCEEIREALLTIQFHAAQI